MATVVVKDGVPVVSSGNWSAVGAYEPGSVGKIITIAGALEDGAVTPERDVHRPVAARLHGQPGRRHPQRLAPARPGAAVGPRHPRRVVERRHDLRGQRDRLRTSVPLPDRLRAGRADRARVPRGVGRHPQAVAGVGGHRTVHHVLRPGSRVDSDPARRGRQRDRQRRDLRGATARARYGRRRWRDHRCRTVGDPHGREPGDGGADAVDHA